MGLKSIYYSIEDKYYSFIEWLANNGLNFKPLIGILESKGIPSLPVIFALLLIAIGGAIFFLNPNLLLPSASTTVLSISVKTAAGLPVDGATVVLLGANNLNLSQTTDANGVVSFSGVTVGQTVRVSVSKAGFPPVSRSVMVGVNSIISPFVLSGSTQGRVTLLVTTEQSEPVGNAQVSYVVNGETRNTITSSQGVATLNAPVGAPVSVTVTAQGYPVATDLFTPTSETFQHTITLSSSTHSIPDFNNLRRNAAGVPSPNDDAATDASRTNLDSVYPVTVTVTNSTGFLPGATVALFDAVSQTQLGANITGLDGKAVFAEISGGVSVYAAVDAEGYVSATSLTRTVSGGPLGLSVQLALPTNDSASNLTVIFSDDAHSPAFAVDLVIWDSLSSPQQRLKQQVRLTRVSNVIQNLPAGKTVYLSAYSSGHVRYVSDPFVLQAGPNNTAAINLTKLTPENSVNVNVNVVDFYNAPVSNANVSAMFPSERFLIPTVPTTAGVAVLTNMPLHPVVIRVVNGSFTGEANLDVSLTNNNVTVQLLPSAATVKLRTVNMHTGAVAVGSTFTVSYTYGGETVNLAGCPLTNVDVQSPVENTGDYCQLTLASQVMYTVKASNSNYFDKIQTFSLAPGETKQVDVTMSSTADNQVLPDDAFHIFDQDGTDVSTYTSDETGFRILQAGKIYTAVFSINVQPNDVGAGAYLRLGDEATSTGNDNALIYKGFPLDDDDLINSGEFNLRGATSYSTGNCGNPVAPAQIGTFKWLNAFKNTTASTSTTTFEVKVPFLVTKSTPNRLNVSYRAYSVSPGGIYTRSPSDSMLGTQQQTSTRSECAAATYYNTFKVAPLPDTIVQCANEACLLLTFAQGGNHGGEGFGVRPALLRNDTFPQRLSLFYSILDFNPDFDAGTELTFKTDKNVLAIIRQDEQRMPVNAASFKVTITDNTYHAVSKTPARVTGDILSTPTSLQAIPDYTINLAYGNKVTLATTVNMLGLPQEAVALSALPSHYVLLYNASPSNPTQDDLTLLSVNGSTATNVTGTGIDFYVDPLLPADAALLLFNFSSSPCQELVFQTFDSSGCFEQVNDPKSVLSLPEEYSTYGNKLLMMKYDASTNRCAYYSKDPNSVKVTKNASTLRVVSTCTQKAIEIPLNIKVAPSLALDSSIPATLPQAPASAAVNFKPEYQAVRLAPKVWDEPAVPALGVDASFMHVLLNNRQYSADKYVRIFQGETEADATDYLVLDNAVVVPTQGIKPILTRDEALPSLFGISSDSVDLLDIHAPGQQLSLANSVSGSTTITFEDQPQSMESSRNEVLNVLRNTAFRRRQDCNPPRPCPFGMFPYNVFVDIKQTPITYHLGGALWTGKEGVGKIDFEFQGLSGEKCTQRNEEGVYDYNWQYLIRPEDGNVQQDKKYAPISVGSLDYATFGCSNTLSLCGKLSFNGGQCINNCGDGWYYNASLGTTGSLCNKDTFKVNDFRQDSASRRETLASKWVAAMANGVASCVATELLTTPAGCAAGAPFGPGGAMVGSILGSFVGNQVYDLAAGNRITDAITSALGPEDMDVPGFASFTGKWAAACSYAGTALDVANAVSFFKTATLVTQYTCPNVVDAALSKCLCLGGAGVHADFNPDGSCAIQKALKTLISSAAVRDQISGVTKVADHIKSAQDATEQFKYPNGKPIAAEYLSKSQKEIVDNAKADLEEAKQEAISAGSCSDGQDARSCAAKLDDVAASVGTLDQVYTAACGPLLSAQALLIMGGAAYEEVPRRAYLSINENGNMDFGGGFLGIGGSDVDCADNSNIKRENFDVWTDLDFRSLRVKANGQPTKCVDKPEIQTYAQSDDGSTDVNTDPSNIDSVNKIGTFYITSRGK